MLAPFSDISCVKSRFLEPALLTLDPVFWILIGVAGYPAAPLSQRRGRDHGPFSIIHMCDQGKYLSRPAG